MSCSANPTFRYVPRNYENVFPSGWQLQPQFWPSLGCSEAPLVCVVQRSARDLGRVDTHNLEHSLPGFFFSGIGADFPGIAFRLEAVKIGSLSNAVPFFPVSTFFWNLPAFSRSRCLQVRGFKKIMSQVSCYLC